MVDVGKTKDNWRQEDDCVIRSLGKHKERDRRGSKENFLCYWTLNQISVRFHGAADIQHYGRILLTAIIVRYPIHPWSTASKPRRRIQPLQRPSAIPASNSGPTNRIAVSRTVFAASTTPIGKYPNLCKTLSGLAVPLLSKWERMPNVLKEHKMQAAMTDCNRPRITEGASRDRVAEGRVVEER